MIFPSISQTKKFEEFLETECKKAGIGYTRLVYDNGYVYIVEDGQWKKLAVKCERRTLSEVCFAEMDNFKPFYSGEKFMLELARLAVHKTIVAGHTSLIYKALHFKVDYDNCKLVIIFEGMAGNFIFRKQ